MRVKPRVHVPPPGTLEIEVLDDDLIVFRWDIEGQRRPQLTAAERSVLGLIARGDSNAAIARARRTSVHTVANQVAGLLRKLGADSRIDLIRRYPDGVPE